MTAENYLAAVSGATGGAAKAAKNSAAVIQRSIDSQKITDVSITAAMVELVRVSSEMDEIDSETRTAVRLVIASPSNVKSASLLAAGKLRQCGQKASASTGRVESAYHSGSSAIVTDASLANVMRAGMTIVYAATEAARQLDVVAGKIKV